MLSINVDVVKVPVGYGRRNFIGKSTDTFLKIHKHSIYNPTLKPEHDTLCLAAAIVVSRAYATDVNQFNFLTDYQNYEDLISETKNYALMQTLIFPMVVE